MIKYIGSLFLCALIPFATAAAEPLSFNSLTPAQKTPSNDSATTSVPTPEEFQRMAREMGQKKEAELNQQKKLQQPVLMPAPTTSSLPAKSEETTPSTTNEAKKQQAAPTSEPANTSRYSTLPPAPAATPAAAPPPAQSQVYTGFQGSSTNSAAPAKQDNKWNIRY